MKHQECKPGKRISETNSSQIQNRVSRITIHVLMFLFVIIELQPSTRFSAKPAFANTFVNFQQEKSGPGFISERERLDLGRSNITNSESKSKSVFSNTVMNNLNAKVSFQYEDKMKSSIRQDAKI